VGPFMFKERAVGDHITLVRSSYYYDKSRVHLDSIVFKIMTDPTARTENLRAHDIDVEDRIQSTDLQSVKGDSSLRVIKQTSLGYTGITINIGNTNGVGKPYETLGTPLSQSADLRQAFELALDRNLINHIVFGGVQRPSCSPFPDQSPYAAAEKGIPCHLRASVAAAKAAFKRSGASAPVDVHLLLGTTTVAARLGALIEGMEKKVGFNVIPEPTEFATQTKRAEDGKFDAFTLGWTGRVDPDGSIYQIVNSKGSANYSGYSNAIVDRATNQARSIFNPKRRIEQYHIALAKIAKDLPQIYLYNAINRFGVSRKVAGVQVYGDGVIRVAFAGFKK
jgi:peptide/nickel transport system substrate-binding protein